MVYPKVKDTVSVPKGIPSGTLFVDVGDTYGQGLTNLITGKAVSLEDCARGYWTDRNLSAAHASQCNWLAARMNGRIQGMWKIDTMKGWMSCPPAIITSRPVAGVTEPRSICDVKGDDQVNKFVGQRVHLGRTPNPLRGYFLAFFMLLCGSLCEMVNAGEVSISDVIAQQRYPWNGKVDISYTVSGDIAAKAKEEGQMTTLKVSAIDQTTSTTNIAATLSGDVSLAEGTHKIVWDMNAQGLTFKSTNVVFNVSCEEETALYCIVDLSAGTTAESYSVSYTNEIPGGSWGDEYKTTKLALRRIEPGTCVVTVDKPYYIGVFEFTQKQYELVMGLVQANDPLKPIQHITFSSVRGESDDEISSESVLGKLRVRTGLAFDLPSENQWEYACRAGTTTVYYYGDTPNGNYMWYSNNALGDTRDVGLTKPNQWGLYDMHGNVYEWCLERWMSVGGHMHRGGSAESNATHCTSSYRDSEDHPLLGNHHTGIRIVKNQSK